MVCRRERLFLGMALLDTISDVSGVLVLISALHRPFQLH